MGESTAVLAGNRYTHCSCAIAVNHIAADNLRVHALRISRARFHATPAELFADFSSVTIEDRFRVGSVTAVTASEDCASMLIRPVPSRLDDVSSVGADPIRSDVVLSLLKIERSTTNQFIKPAFQDVLPAMVPLA